ncbi:MAG TPA: hypothetical protein VEO53_07550 [Candidatus Binatia bacterium]|nr:hypothetical protein [Candidatus Binatia bacterium]
MKNSKFVGGLIALSLALPFAVATGSAEPSAKATAETSSLVLLPATSGTGAWVYLLSSTIKTPNGKELFITAAFEAGLFTHTEAEGGDISQAQATVQVRVLVDGAEVNPGPVVYANRIQTLTSHLDDNEEIQLTLDTAGAASFTFVANDVPVGEHTVTAQARVVTSGFSDWEALGAVGKGSLTVEEVRMVNGQ